MSTQANFSSSATLTVVSNFAWQHMKAATLFRDQVLRLENEDINKRSDDFFEQIRSYASACVMSSVASLETLINELFIAPNLALRPTFSNFEEQFWGEGGMERKNTLKKYQLALSRLDLPKLDEHATPYREASALIELRNVFIHYKPTWDPDRQRKIDLIKELKGKFPYSPFSSVDDDFVTMKCMGSGCAIWAINSVLKFLREFDANSNLDPDKMSNFWKFET